MAFELSSEVKEAKSGMKPISEIWSHNQGFRGSLMTHHQPTYHIAAFTTNPMPEEKSPSLMLDIA